MSELGFSPPSHFPAFKHIKRALGGDGNSQTFAARARRRVAVAAAASYSQIQERIKQGGPMSRREQRAYGTIGLMSAVAVGVIATGVMIALFLYARHGATIATWIAGRAITADTALGAWGDSFGALNATVSTLAFVGVLITLRLQGRGLREQAQDQHRQRFEASFFELLKLLREARRELQFYNTPQFEHARSENKYTTFSAATTGRLPSHGKVDPIAAADLEIHFQLLEGRGLKRCRKDDLVNVYMRYVHSASESTVAPYFRIIYSILDRVRQDEVLSRDDKIRYTNLVRSQLSSAEVLLLGVNSLTPVSADMKALVTEFRMLKYLPDSSMRDLLRRFHDPVAFTGRDDPSSNKLEHEAEERKRFNLLIVSALRRERIKQSLSRKSLATRIGQQGIYVADYEEGRIELGLVDLVAISRGLQRRPAFFLNQ